jgi:hypothetical protein
VKIAARVAELRHKFVGKLDSQSHGCVRLRLGFVLPRELHIRLRQKTKCIRRQASQQTKRFHSVTIPRSVAVLKYISKAISVAGFGLRPIGDRKLVDRSVRVVG